MLILHANWHDRSLHLWAESLAALAHGLSPESAAAGGADDERPATVAVDACSSLEDSDDKAVALLPPQKEDGEHPFAAGAEELAEMLRSLELLPEEALSRRAELALWLPGIGAADRYNGDRVTGGSGGATIQPSARLSSLLGLDLDEEHLFLDRVNVSSLSIEPGEAVKLLLRLNERGSRDPLHLGTSVQYWITAARIALDLLADQRFIPTLVQHRGDQLRGAWKPWLHDDDCRRRIGALLDAMPPIARAADGAADTHPWTLLDDALGAMVDAVVRSVLISDDYESALDGLDAEGDPHVAWLQGLLGRETIVTPAPSAGTDMLRDVGRWIGRLDERSEDQPLRLCFRLNEPFETAFADEQITIDDSLTWRLSLHLQPADDPASLIDAEEVWGRTNGSRTRRRSAASASPQELLLAELGRASRVYPRIEAALTETAPTGVELTTTEAHEFLTQHKPVLEEAGFRVFVPEWWDDPASRLGARLQLESPEIEEIAARQHDNAASVTSALGLHALVHYRWQIAIGEQLLTLEEFQQIAQSRTPLVHLRGRWVEIRPDDMARAASFLTEQSEGEMKLLDAIHIAYGAGGVDPGLPVFGLDAKGWVGELLGASAESQNVPVLEQPEAFRGTLRPYQKTGLSWLAFLDRFGLGACLADDMGLGKTIQLIALLLHERSAVGIGPTTENAESRESRDTCRNLGATLLVVPTSVVGNWVSELKRFAPELRVQVHHGPERLMGDAFCTSAEHADIVITTYALVSRDRELLISRAWHRVVLDEAQSIKNPPTKQAASIRALRTDRRIALTGTPVENRLSELWSIMEFCNPGYLGDPAEFRRTYSIPIERHRDQRRAHMLRGLIQPFVLRRLKTDPKVISDLPACVETREYATLTGEQAKLYDRTVKNMLQTVDRAEGIQRRGLVLATLVKLKQICNHPAQALGESVAPDDAQIAALPRRSGKVRRLLELLEEVLATGERALVFTQFRAMGHLLTAMVQHELDREALFLHGGTPSHKRQLLIDRFQSGDPSSPVFVLSLKAGGLGLNLTAANHVFHFDRWWNPAVENQATDRAFRIGQTRTVHVHKFVCQGTLEERIDQMIEQKTELAQNIIGSGEQWLTELTTGQLQELLRLRESAMEIEG